MDVEKSHLSEQLYKKLEGTMDAARILSILLDYTANFGIITDGDESDDIFD